MTINSVAPRFRLHRGYVLERRLRGRMTCTYAHNRSSYRLDPTVNFVWEHSPA